MASRSKHPPAKSKAKKSDAIALLMADHRQVDEWFLQFKKASSSSEKQQLAQGDNGGAHLASDLFFLGPETNASGLRPMQVGAPALSIDAP